MIRATLTLGLIALALPAAAQTWKQVPGAANASLSIDTAGIKREGKWRVFRTRTTSLGMEGTIIGTAAMDCAAGITELRGQRLLARGRVVRERVFPIGKRPRQKIANPAKDPAFRIVCRG
ncbi:hypothetical protein [Sphingomonas sp.]|uniref:hypothetical protein n=1 Tax=Sphingomonas sp. TaxID=28214 RepID=UPI000BCEE55F|nr:hypothetical protein [Sphingomonas sp.]MBA4762420.1 hypothetical protein [Sphingomonas sp.]OYX50891.1 MAG: hypothetical protein B7Y97_06680 [Sphingomonas sp. 32-66-10]